MSHSKKAHRRRLHVNRRKFLETSLAAGVAAAALATPALRARTRRGSAFESGAHAADSFQIEEATIAGLQEAMRGGKMSARDIAEKYIERIERFDRKGAALNSVIELNPDALSIASELDRERKTRGARSPLHGIPILLKDNIDTGDRMQTTAGSLALVGQPAPRDAFVAERLRAAGAVILGKTNLSEWANFRSTHSTSGWSGRGGQTRNPYAIDRNPCGSSSGSGVAVAANFAAAAIGTETDGSIVCPSSASGIVGIKPTLGLVSRSGIIPIAHSQDTAGPMTRTVADAALVLSALTGIDPRDRATQASRGKSHADYTRFLDPVGLRGARIGVARKFFGFSDKVDKLMTGAIDALKGAGAIVVDPADLPSHGKYDDSEFEVLLYEFKADLNKYLAERGGGVPRSLKELIEFNERNREREMPYFGQEIFIKAQAKGALTSKPYLAALAKNHRLSRAEGIDAAMTKHRLDAIIAPTGGPPWTTDHVNGDHFSGGSSTPAAVAGYPNINVPAGFVYGLPVGISFFGRAYSEPVLIRLAYAYEQATKHRRPPQF
ncbi:MAG TPA: amidase, partial [Pyrinomonadaceae bacterium]|nr:amidase [Pyrinomonadaceae bacterium]